MTADELLQNTVLSEGSVETTTEDDNICIIDPKTREIQLPVGGLLLGVESDEKVERIVFQCPKIVGDGVDLSTLAIRINYSNANNEGSQSIAENVQEHGDNITFEWLLPRHVTMYKGTVNFIICAVKAENYIISNEWNTTLAKATVLEGLEVDQVEVPSDQQDVIAQLIQLINAAQKSTSEDAASAKASAESAALSKTSASDSATVASNAQKAAQQSATEAASSAGSAADSASSAEQSKTSAEESANAAKQSEDNVKQIADNIGIDDNVVSPTQLWSSEKGVKSFAPLVSALKVSGSGDGLVSLTPTVPWYLQGLRLFGKTTQEKTPGPESPVPLVNAGENGNVTMQITDGNGHAQQMLCPVHNDLPGIPVSNGGNYTDESGQQWLCDEVDFAAGVYTRNLGVKTFDGTEVWNKTGTNVDRFFNSTANKGVVGFCNYFDRNKNGETVGGVSFNKIAMGFAYSAAGQTTVEQWKAWLAEKNAAGTPLLVLYALAEPVTESISAETLTAYAGLQSYAGTTNIQADGCGIEATAIADTDVYMSQQFEKFLQMAKEYTDQKMQQSTEPEQ